MVHAKYIKRGKKVFGPYYYESYRENGKVKTRYVGIKAEKKKKFALNQRHESIIFNKLVPIFSIFLVVLMLLFIKTEITGNLIFLEKESFKQNEDIAGSFVLELKEGELLPADSLIKIQLGGIEKQLTLQEFIEKSGLHLSLQQGNFYSASAGLQGSGMGYGWQGSKESYPTLSFELEITPAPAESGEKQITMESRTISGSCSKNHAFEMQLSNEEAELVPGSVKIEGNSVADSLISFSATADKVAVTTDYSKIEQGFGAEYFGENKHVITLDLSKLNLALDEQGTHNLIATLSYENNVLVQDSRAITITALQTEEQPEEKTILPAEITEYEIQQETDWWPMFHHDLNHSGYTTERGPLINRTLWRYTTGDYVASSPAVANGVVYIGSEDNNIYALNASNGSKIWNYTTGGNIDSSPAVVNNVVYVGSNDNRIYALNASNGSQIWNYSTGNLIAYSSPAVADEIIYVSSWDDNVYALNASNGSKIWNYTTGGSYSPAVVNGIVYVGSDDNKVYALNASNGSKIWDYTTGGNIDSSPAVVNNVVYVGSYDNKVYALNASNGSQIWNYTTGDDVFSSPAVVNNVVYVGSNDNRVYALNASNGSQIWNYTTGDDVFSSPAVVNNVVYVGSYDNKVYALNASNGSKIWDYIAGGYISSSPAIANDIVYIGSNGYVYAIGGTNTAPLVYLESPANSSYVNNATPSFVFNATDSEDAILRCELLIDSSGYGINSSVRNATSTIIFANHTVSEGLHSWKINCSDNWISNISETRWFTVDTTKPLISFVPPTPQEGVVNKTIIINVTAEDETSLSRIEIAIDSSIRKTCQASPCTYAWDTIVEADLQHIINASAVDSSNNANSTIRNFNVSNPDAWNMFHHDLWHVGYTTATGPLINRTLWTYTTGDVIYYSSSAVTNGVVYIGSADNRVYALNASNGSQIWNYTTGDDVFSSPAVVNGVVYVGSFDNNIYALNASNGSQIWNYTTEDYITFSSPAVAGGIVYVGSGDNRVYALNASNGSQIWNYTTGADVYSSPAVANGIVYIGSLDNKIYALNATNGSKIWNYTTGGYIDSSPAVANGIVYVGSQDNRVYALNATNGSKIWNYTTGGYVSSSPAVANGVVYVGSTDSKVYALNASNGSKIWNYTTGGVIYSSPAVADGVVYVGSLDNKIYALNASNGSKIWNYTTGNDIFSSPAVANGVVYVGSLDNKIYAIGGTNTAPQVYLESPANSSYINSNAPSFVFNATDAEDAILRCELLIDNARYGINSSVKNATSTIMTANHTVSEGLHSWKVNCSDSWLSNVSETRAFTVDITPPYVAIISPQNTTYNNATQLVNITTSGANNTWYNWNGTNVTYTASVYVIFAEGSNILYAYVNDTVGNVNSSSVAFIIDVITPPVITIVNPLHNAVLDSGTTSTAINISTNENAECRYSTSSTFNFSDGTLFIATGNLSHTFVYSGLSNGQTYNLYYKCNDTAGNINPTATQHSFSVASPADWWPMFHHDLNHSGYTTEQGPLTNDTLWVYTTGGIIDSSPAIINNVVYIGSADNRVYALNVNGGSQIWNYTTEDGIYSSPAVANGVVYIGSDDDRIYALNAGNGIQIWNYTTDGWVDSSPVVANGIVYVGSDDGNVYAIYASNGSQKWNYTMGGGMWASPAVVDEIVYVGSYDGNVYALNENNGGLNWSYTTGDYIMSSPAVADGIVYIGSADDNVYALNANNGSQKWNYTTGDDIYSSPAVTEGIVYIGSYDGNVYALNASSGSQKWNYTIGSGIFSSPAVAAGVVYIGSDDNNVYALNASNGSLIWGYTTESNIWSAFAVVNGILYVSSEDGNVYAIGTVAAPPTNTAPQVYLESPANNSYINNNTPSFVFNATDAEDATLSCELLIESGGYGVNSSVLNATSTTMIANHTVSEGAHSWKINCSDGSLSNTSETRWFIVDTIKPLITITSPLNTSYNKTAIALNWTSNEPLKGAWYSLNNQANISLVNFSEHTIATAASGAKSVYAIDLDSDNDIDVLSASQYDDKIAWYENNGSQNFTVHNIATNADGASSVYAIDLDSDNDIDVLSASTEDKKIAWYENNGSQNFTAHTIATISWSYPSSVFAIDLDSDNDVDVLSASYGGSGDKIAWYENNGFQSFTAHTITAAASGAKSVYAIDLDSDSDIDVLSASASDDKIAWYENNGFQSFTVHNITINADEAESVFAIDLDSDNDIDVLSASTADQKIAWYENNGFQSFTAHTITAAASGAKSVFAIDLDSDNDIDVLSASGGNKIAWYEASYGNTTITASEGSNIIRVYGKDLADNLNSSSVTFTIDTTPPLITIVYPQNTTYNYNISSLNYTVSDANLQACWYSLNNGQTNTTITCGTNMTGLTSNEGSNTWRVYANDSIGNKNSTSVTFFKDTIKPLIQFVTPTTQSGNYSQNFIIANVTASDANLQAIIARLYKSTALINTTTSSSSPLYINFTNLDDGTYYLNATANDSLGNSNSTETRTIVLDTIPPFVSIASPENKTYNNATILVNITATDISGISSRWYNWNGTNATYIIPVNVTFNEGSNTLYAWANDTVGNVNSTSVAFNVDITPANITIVNPLQGATLPSGTTSTEVNISTNENATCRYSTTSTFNFADGTLFTETGSLSHTFVYSGLSNGQTYNLYYKCNDTAGNINPTATQHTFSVASPPGPPACTNECTPDGNKECYNSTAYRQCGNYDADACLEWSSPTGCGVGKKCENGECISIVCEENWTCSAWSICIDGLQTRTCNDLNNCGTQNNKPPVNQTCMKFIGNFDITSPISFTMIKNEKAIFTSKNANRTIELTGLYSSSVDFKIDSKSYSATTGNSVLIDVNNDNIADLSFLLTSISGGKAYFTGTAYFVNHAPIITIYAPLTAELWLKKNVNQTFSINAIDQDNDLITASWELGNSRVKDQSATGAVYTEYIHKMKENTTLVVSVSDGELEANMTWKIYLLPETACEENWKCDWTDCKSDGFRYAENCTDINNCNTTLNKPSKASCAFEIPEIIERPAPSLGCISDWNCTEWEECQLEYDVAKLLADSAKEAVEGIQERICYDLSNCSAARTERMSCSKTVSIRVESATICYEPYIQIYEKETDRLIAQIKEKTAEVSGIQIDLSATEIQKAKFCWYCFDIAKDFDETYTDCGGPSCQECLLDEYEEWLAGRDIQLAPAINEIIYFKVLSELHSLKVIKVNNIEGTATFEITSSPQLITLHVGETKNIDVNGDGAWEIKLTLEKIDEKAGFIIKSLMAAMPAPPAAIPFDKIAIWILIASTILVFVIFMGNLIALPPRRFEWPLPEAMPPRPESEFPSMIFGKRKEKREGKMPVTKIDKLWSQLEDTRRKAQTLRLIEKSGIKYAPEIIDLGRIKENIREKLEKVSKAQEAGLSKERLAAEKERTKQFLAIEKEIEHFERIKGSLWKPYPSLVDIEKIRENIREKIKSAEKVKTIKTGGKTEKEKEFEKMLESIKKEIDNLEMLRDPKISGAQKTPENQGFSVSRKSGGFSRTRKFSSEIKYKPAKEKNAVEIIRKEINERLEEIGKIKSVRSEVEKEAKGKFNSERKQKLKKFDEELKRIEAEIRRFENLAGR